MKKYIFIVIFLALIATVIYAIEKSPNIKGVTTNKIIEPSTNPSPTESRVSNEQSEITNNKDVIFDVPSIMSLKKDDILKKLGTPIEAPPEPEDGIERGGTWRIAFQKDKYKLLVLYQLESKSVFLAYIEGNDKDELIKVSGAKQNAKDYVYDFFMDIQDTNKVLGIRFESKFPNQINASVTMAEKGFILTNKENIRLKDCEYFLNDEWWFSSPDGNEVNKPRTLKYVDFRLLSKPDKEFDIDTMKPKKFELRCNNVIQKNRRATFTF